MSNTADTDQPEMQKDPGGPRTNKPTAEPPARSTKWIVINRVVPVISLVLGVASVIVLSGRALRIWLLILALALLAVLIGAWKHTNRGFKLVMSISFGLVVGALLVLQFHIQDLRRQPVVVLDSPTEDATVMHNHPYSGHVRNSDASELWFIYRPVGHDPQSEYSLEGPCELADDGSFKDCTTVFIGLPDEKGGDFELSPVLTDDETSSQFHELKKKAGYKGTFLAYRPAGALDTVWILSR